MNSDQLIRRHAVGHRFALRIGVLLLSALALAGCGGGGGSSKQEQPLAAAIVVGATDQTTRVTVRAGSEIVLNGENSDGTRFPLANATWTQTDSSGIVVRLDKRTDKTRAFRVPFVDVVTTLTFELEVRNEDGDTAINEVVVDIIPVSDSDRFLEYFRSLPNQYIAVAVLKQGMTATTAVGFTVTQRQTVNYANRNSTSNAPNQFDVEISSPISHSSNWLAGTTGDWTTFQEAANVYYNPNVCFSIPRLDIDDINIFFDDIDDGSGIAEHQRDTVEHFVDLTLDVTGGSCTDADGATIDCQDAVTLLVLKSNGELVDALGGSSETNRVVGVDVLKASDDIRFQPESAVTAKAYYGAIDPMNRRTTLSDWLFNAGFTDAAGNQVATDVNSALYINNYDLGFTRDMFVRTADDGTLFAYVVNFPALRPAIIRKNPDLSDGDVDVLATVAMEFGAPDQAPDAAKLTKFFVFVPDGDGEQVRVNSLNFDGRGEKWVPGACTSCHGGLSRPLETVAGALVYPDNGDIDAAFLPWDLESFLFVDAADARLIDPLVTEGLRLNPNYLQPEELQQFSRESQESAFRAMNEAVLTTMSDPTRFSVVRDQVHGWYGNEDDTGNDLPNVSYNGSYIQDGWRESEAANAGVDGLEDFYLDVFARHCRICHSQAKEINNFGSWTQFQATTALIQRVVYEDGVMPNARIDMDRLWVDYHGDSPNAAERLASILGIDPGLATGPGKPFARIQGAAIQTAMPRDALVDIAPDLVVDVQNLGSVRLDASISSFVEDFSWSLSAPAGSIASLVGANTAKPAFMVDMLGTYTVTLTGSNTLSTGEVLESVASVIVEAAPSIPQAINDSGPLMISETIPDDISTATITTAQLQWLDLDSADTLLLFRVVTAPTNGTISLNGTPTSQFTQQDINDGLVTYTEGLVGVPPVMNDSFEYTIEDETGTPFPGTFDIQIQLRNDRPVQINNATPMGGVLEAGSRTIDESILQWDDEDDGPGGVRYIFSSVPVNGTLICAGVTLADGGSCLQSQIIGDMLTYQHDGSQTTSDMFTFTVTDDDATTTPQAPSTTPFVVNITPVDDAPVIQTSAVSVFAGLQQVISGSLQNDTFGGGNIAVFDLDTTTSASIAITVVSGPSNGTIEVNSTPSTTFTMADILDNLVVYVHADPYDNTNDSFTVSVSDGTTSSAAASVSVTVDARTDGPMPSGDLALNLDSYLDPDVSRDGSETSWTGTDTPPWRSVAITTGDLGFFDGADLGSPLPGQCGIEYRIVTNTTFGRIRRQTGPSTFVTVDNSGGASGTFTQAEIVAGMVTYENRTIGDGDVDATDVAAELQDFFTFVATDCILEFPAPGGTPNRVTIERKLCFGPDVGWVIDSRWTQAPSCASTPVQQSSCRACHGGTNVCGTGTSTSFTTTATPGGTLDYGRLAGRMVSNVLPIEATLSVGHSGGRVISPGSNPFRMLQQWEAEGLDNATSCP